LVLLAVISCRPRSNPTPQLASGKAFVLPSDSVLEVIKSKPTPPWAPKKYSYKPSKDRHWDLIHTRLELQFDWEKQRVPGKADLHLEPYFYPQTQLELDAKGFDIHLVEARKGKQVLALTQEYDGMKLKIRFSEAIIKGEKIVVSIAYTAKPNDLPEGGGRAITKDKGIYFINPDGKDPNKPRQIWTQGEPEAASCWFPTIDAPNERCTSEIQLTVEDRYKTLSNGLKTSSKKEANGLRTDLWEMKLPHAPYLFMVAVGDFAVIEDPSGPVPMKYWVEPKHAAMAKRIFGRTPEMIRFFGKRLGYPFPWAKYDQIVVRDFVSGAMENTTASVFMEALQLSAAELVDRDWDDIIAHELFHQWFGDLVTLESWSHLPLNESFANYSQYLWEEYRLGQDNADLNALKEKNQYFMESTRKREPMIRFFHNVPDDMFDSHSYAKGGRILHMLRKELGDEAFFGGLKLYLNRHAFKSVEIQDLRLAFEEVSGRDLLWFFEQWFMQAGHPELDIKKSFQSGKLVLEVRQVQDTTYFPVYRLNVPIEIRTGTVCQKETLRIDQMVSRFEFPLPGMPDVVIWDPGAVLLAQTEWVRTEAEWMAQFRLAEKGIDRLEALQELKSRYLKSENAKPVFIQGLSDVFWGNRLTALDAVSEWDSLAKATVLGQLKKMASADPKSYVRAQAIRVLGQLRFPEKKELLGKAIADSSLETSTQAYKAYLRENYPDADLKVKSLKTENQAAYTGVLSDYYSARPGKVALEWYLSTLSKPEVSDPYDIIQGLGRMLGASSDTALVAQGTRFLFELAMKETKAEQVIGAFQVLKQFQQLPGVADFRKQILELHKESDFVEVLEYLR
jgi:aminopeptidase N